MMNQGTSPPNSQQPHHHHRRHGLVERCSTLRACDPCKRKKKVCNGQRPCHHCISDGGGKKETTKSCVYSVVPDHARGVFTTTNARRLSSGSACETCRRRKTKCDGASPCGYCASNQLECINLQSSRKRSLVATSLPISSSSSTTTTTTTNAPIFSSPLSNLTAGSVISSDQTMDRIEDRLQRIEKLMVAFSDNTTSSSSSSTSVYRKLSTPQQSITSNNNNNNYIRPHRHSVQGISVAKEQVELRTALAMSRSKGFESPTPPPALTSSMFNLTLSPSSSTSTLDDHTMETTTTTTRMPSCMDQLSKRTFNHSSMDYGTVHYPIYPLTLPSSPQ